jgi:hypothetical protein
VAAVILAGGATISPGCRSIAKAGRKSPLIAHRNRRQAVFFICNYSTESTSSTTSKPAFTDLARISGRSHPIFVISITVGCYEKNK